MQQKGLAGSWRPRARFFGGGGDAVERRKPLRRSPVSGARV